MFSGRERHDPSGCHCNVIIPTPLNTLGGLGTLEPKACVEVVELYAGSPWAGATGCPCEMKAEAQET